MVARFNAMAATLERQHEMRAAFIAGVAHDLKTPLAALALTIGQLSPDKPLPPEPRLRKLIVMTRRQVTRLERMIGDLVDATRSESDALALALEACDLRDLARDAIALFEATSSSHELVLRAGEDALVVECDPGRIHQVVNNLVSNAIKYSPDGGRIVIGLGAERERAAISVEDHGVGIPSSEIQEILEPFKRASGAASRAPGSGLGLYVVNRIVQAHGGELRVESTPGAGSRFTVLLPRLENAGAGRSPDVRRAHPQPH